MSRVVPSKLDAQHYDLIRQNVSKFLRDMCSRYSKPDLKVLDIAPQEHEGAEPYFEDAIQLDTLDIDPESGCTYIADICDFNPIVPDNHYDLVVCTEVLEHTLRPFDAVQEIHRILKVGGKLLLSVPFNFRIHGPLPDCWRFTEHGLRSLLDDFTIVELAPLETVDRPLMPVHYTVVAEKAQS